MTPENRGDSRLLSKVGGYAREHLVTFDLSCFEEQSPDGVSVYFEPEGADHRLLPGESFRVECYPPDGKAIEVVHHPDGISLFIGDEWGVRAFRKDGTQLKL